MEKKVSIIIPSYNQGHFIEQTIKSILNQQYSETEIIIIDGGSTDNTLNIIQKYQKYLAYWISEPDKGQAHAINKGLSVATGEIFNWINSDDLLEHRSLETINEFFSRNQHANILCGFTRCFWDNDNATSHEYRMGLKSSVAETIFHVEMNQPATFYRTDVVKKLGGINESLRYVFDDELWFRYLCRYGTNAIGFTEKRIAQFRLHQDSKSVNEGYAKFNKELQDIYIYLSEILKFPSWLTESLKAKPHSGTYVSNLEWDIHHLEIEKFKAFFAQQSINSLYLAGKVKEAREALHIIKQNGLFKWNRLMTSLRLKLMFS